MKKAYLIVSIFILIVSTFTGCVSQEKHHVPDGTWVSDDEKMVIIIGPDSVGGGFSSQPSKMYNAKIYYDNNVSVRYNVGIGGPSDRVTFSSKSAGVDFEGTFSLNKEKTELTIRVNKLYLLKKISDSWEWERIDN